MRKRRKFRDQLWDPDDYDYDDDPLELISNEDLDALRAREADLMREEYERWMAQQVIELHLE